MFPHNVPSSYIFLVARFTCQSPISVMIFPFGLFLFINFLSTITGELTERPVLLQWVITLHFARWHLTTHSLDHLAILHHHPTWGVTTGTRTLLVVVRGDLRLCRGGLLPTITMTGLLMVARGPSRIVSITARRPLSLPHLLIQDTFSKLTITLLHPIALNDE